MTESDVAAVEPDELRDGLLARLTELVGDAVVESHILPGKDIWVRVRPDAWADVAHSVRFTMGARYFGFLSAIDWMPSPFGRSMDSAVDNVVKGAAEKKPEEQTTGFAGGDTRFQVFARVANVRDKWGITLKADVGDESPSIGTWTKVYAGADWHEREAYEMFGIDFVGHPGLRKIYLPGDFEGNPLRKDFPLLARMVKPWPGIVDVEPMPGGDDDDENAEGES
ncbi:MAG: NADH-quinone oxidoreductase subunit C [Acidimicrobiales bacterium]